jgi:O-antigen ligase
MKSISRNRYSLDTFLFSFCVIMTTLILPLSEQSAFAAGGIILFTFMYFVYKYPVYLVFKMRFVKILVAFLIWSSLVSLFAEYDIAVALSTQRRVLGVILFSLIHVFFVYFNPNKTYILFQIYFISLIILLAYILNDSNILTSYQIDDRSTGSVFDPNTIGYYVFNGIFATFFLYSLKKRNKVFALTLFSVIIISFYLLLSVATRGGMLVFFISTFFYLLVLLTSVRSKKVKLLLIIISFIVMSFAAIQLFGFIVEKTYLGQRVEMAKNKESTRSMLIKEGIRIGMNNFILGVGGGNFSRVPRRFERGSFSHSSYTEAFANYGGPGLLLLLYLYYDFLLVILKKLKRSSGTNRTLLYLILVFFTSFLLYNLFYVTYLAIVFSGLFFGVRTYVARLKFI